MGWNCYYSSWGHDRQHLKGLEDRYSAYHLLMIYPNEPYINGSKHDLKQVQERKDKMSFLFYSLYKL
ncbi:hypothetical protein OAS1_18410 [Bacillus sp. YKCMOAS1]|nr:hypothetical protein OAS1_18410 [Bacillus sp. YKCMOAS1]